MVTKKRKEALQWFHDRGEAYSFDADAPTPEMIRCMIYDGQLVSITKPTSMIMKFTLTDKGRRDLHDG